jgi:hypothetical protein
VVLAAVVQKSFNGAGETINTNFNLLEAVSSVVSTQFELRPLMEMLSLIVPIAI